jgi:VWFA-related protein
MRRPILKLGKILFALYAACGLGSALGQAVQPQAPAAQQDQTGQSNETATLRATTSIVLVPALVATKAGEPVFTLTADDFTLWDDGVPQKLRLEEDTDKQPIALVVVVEAGGSGVDHLDDYQTIGPMIDNLVGNVEHTVAVVGFDSEAALVQPFTSDMNTVERAILGIGPGDGKAAILDGVNFSVDLLRKQPVRYRRAILLFSETHDHGSHGKLADTVRSVSDTNTAIYSFAFSSTKADAGHEAAGFSSNDPAPDHGCFSREWGGDPTKQPSVVSQDYDCLAELAPPLRLARIAFIAATGALKKNVPETVAHLTGGEYYAFGNRKSLEKGLQTLANHVPNRYLLSFHPENPHPGFHSVVLQLKDRPNLKVESRTGYWAESAISQ